MKVLVSLILGVCLLGLLLLPGFLLVKAFNSRVNSSHQLPIKRYVFMCLALSFGLLGLMGFEFEGAAVSWFLTLMGLNFALCIVCLPVVSCVRIVARCIYGKFNHPDE